MPSLSTLDPRPVAVRSPIERRWRRGGSRLASPSLVLFVILTAQLMVVLDV
jgi:hypothetical protein